MRLYGLVLLALFTTSGCVQYGRHGRMRHATSGAGETIAFGLFLVDAIVASRETHLPPEPMIVPQTIYVMPGPKPAPLPRSPRDRVVAKEGLPSFDPVAARGALSAIDATSCQPSDQPTLYGHAKVTINPDGIVSKVVIDEPEGLTPSTVKCVGDRLGTARVLPFRGSLVTVGTVFRM